MAARERGRAEGLSARQRLLQCLDEVAGRWPDRVAHRSEQGARTYAELRRAAQALTAQLAAAAPEPVLVYGHKEPDLLAAFWACALAGRPYVPVDVALPPARIARMAAIASVRTAVAATAWPPGLAQELGARGVRILQPGQADQAAAPEPGPPSPLAYIVFTSGSSGDPKGVPIHWDALEHFTDWLLTLRRPRPGQEVILNQAPFSFDLSVMDLFLALRSGGTLWSVTRQDIADPRRLFAALADSGLTTWVSTPSFARFCLAEPSFGDGMLPELRQLIFCGEALPPSVARALLARFPRAELWNTYGPTEATVAVTSLRITPSLAARDAPLPVGHPAPGMRVWVAGADAQPVADGERGEILLAGPQLSSGYLQDADGRPGPGGFVTLPASLGGGPAYRTGDAGHVGDGLLYCDGRLDRQVKVRGYRLELEEIEQQLRRLPAVADAAVLPVWRDGVADHLVAFVVPSGPMPPRSAAPAAARQIRSELAVQLPAYALPRLVRLVAALPLTANGKVDRRALEAAL